MKHLSRRAAAVSLAVSTTLLVGPLVATSAQASPAAVSRGVQAAEGNPDFSGIVALSNCSGSIVRWKSSKPKDKALMLTNGHCTRLYGSHDVEVNKPLVRSVRLLNSDGSDRATVNTKTLLYGTMWKTDVSLYSLEVTYATLLSKYDVHPLTISAERPATNERLQIISGYFKKAYRCHLNGFVYRLQEGDWTWHGSLRYNENGCHMVHGTSGSPVLKAGTRTVVGIHNTTNDDGQKCTVNNPCEIDRQGHVTVHQGRHYGEETWLFTTCLGSDRTLDLSLEGCRLPKP